MTLDAQSNDDTILQWLAEVVGDVEDIYLRKPLTQCSTETHLNDELGLDSLGRVNLFYGIIDTLEIEASETEVENWSTLQDVIQFIRSQLK